MPASIEEMLTAVETAGKDHIRLAYLIKAVRLQQVEIEILRRQLTALSVDMRG